jgi:hypothetical protein
MRCIELYLEVELNWNDIFQIESGLDFSVPVYNQLFLSLFPCRT